MCITTQISRIFVFFGNNFICSNILLSFLQTFVLLYFKETVMLKNLQHSATPNLSYWNCERYPYYIPSIKSIEVLNIPFQPAVFTNTPYDEMHICLKGSASYITSSIKSDVERIEVTQNDIIFFRCGMQKYSIIEHSPDYEILKILF